MLDCIVTKFGGSSLADEEQFRKVRDTLELEPARRYLVPSAPGKRFPSDEKVTDLLYICHDLAAAGRPVEDQFIKIRERYLSIAQQLHLRVDIETALDEVAAGIAGGQNRDWCASRGEYLCGILIADYLGWRFVDAAEGNIFREDGTCSLTYPDGQEDGYYRASNAAIRIEADIDGEVRAYLWRVLEMSPRHIVAEYIHDAGNGHEVTLTVTLDKLTPGG